MQGSMGFSLGPSRCARSSAAKTQMFKTDNYAGLKLCSTRALLATTRYSELHSLRGSYFLDT